MDHDRLFKELLRTFFVEFIETFLPAVAAYIDTTSIVFLDKEVFTDISGGRKHIADLVVRVNYRDRPTCFLIHVENQSTSEAEFSERMFRYFARLYEKYGLPIYPVAIFSYDTQVKRAPNRYEVAFPDKTVLKFQYTAIQLNRLPWRRFVKNPNPAATALMAKMKMSKRDRPRVKAECLRILATLKLNPAKSELVGVFVESYLKLTSEENRIYERALSRLDPETREATMEFITSWHKAGREEGLHLGKERMLGLLLNQRFSTLPADVTDQLDRLTSEQLDELALALRDFDSLAVLEEWLTQKLAGS